MAKQLFFIFSTICFMSMSLLSGEANGMGNTYADEKHNNGVAPNSADVTQHTKPAALDDGASLTELKIVKRAPSGFTGMRGKKDYDATELPNDASGDWAIDPLQQAVAEDSTDAEDDGDLTQRRFRKIPIYSVRGRKYNRDDNHLTNMMQILHEDRLRQMVLQDFIDSLATKTAQQNEIAKRAPTGFTGMRGKRPTYTNSGNAAPDTADEFEWYDDGMMQKRAPANVFMGVRGKKDVDHQNFQKRSAAEFYNHNGFSGGGGGKKQQRFVDFGNKFVAVRGKKSSAELLDGLQPARQQFLNELSALWYGDDVSSDMAVKRTPNGFHALRGKRQAMNMQRGAPK